MVLCYKCRHCEEAKCGFIFCNGYNEYIDQKAANNDDLNCEGYEPYEPNIHDDDAARQDPEARNQGIHQDARRAQVDYRKGNGGTRV